MSILSTMAASCAFASGTNRACLPRRRASNATGSTPLTARTAPSKASSPTKLNFSNVDVSISSLTAIIPSAMGRSKLGPSFLISAGARLIVVRPRGQKYPLLLTVAAFLGRRVGQADDDNHGMAAARIYFNFNFVSIYSVNGRGINFRQHRG